MSSKAVNEEVGLGDDTLDEALKNESKIVELSDSDDEGLLGSNGTPSFSKRDSRLRKPQDLPPWLHQATLALFHDELETTTSESRKKVQDDCLPFLTGEALDDFDLNSHGIPKLKRDQHIQFLRDTLNKLPAPYAAMDASRPWLFYWATAGLSTLGADVSAYKPHLIETVRPLQNPTGGFGGGQGQLSHCACSYATTLALACVGGLALIDRPAMWRWLGSVKQPSGGFRMAEGAEEDIRGAYCAMTIITLLNLPLSLPPSAPARAAGLTTFTDRLGDWISTCQTYEGGISASPATESHGAYAFCGLACLSILDAPHVSIPQTFDLPALTAWLASTQTTPEGGFAGRTNKLVDACYSHWVGGCWSLLQAALPPTTATTLIPSGTDIWNREALILYLLSCCQAPGRNNKKGGGMRDKPSVRADGYHTCYSLAGLSHATNRYDYDSAAGGEAGSGGGRLMAAFRWRGEKVGREELRGWRVDEGDVVGFVHPVFVIPFERVEEARRQFEEGGEWMDG